MYVCVGRFIERGLWGQDALGFNTAELYESVTSVLRHKYMLYMTITYKFYNVSTHYIWT